MDYDKKLSDLKEKILDLIKNAASKNDSAMVVTHSKILEEVENLILKSQTISSKIIVLEKQIRQEAVPPPITNIDINQISAKAKGKIRRDIFLKLLNERGIYLSQIKGVLYRSNKSSLIGIASSSEKDEGDRWFLGLPPGSYETIVLLCEKTFDSFYSFILPHDFVTEHITYFSRDSKEHIKFPVLRTNGTFFLTIPGKGNIEILKYLDQFQTL